MSYHPQISFFLDHLSGFSTNVFRLEPQASPTSGPNKIVRVSLPSASLLNMRTFSMFFNANCSSTDPLDCVRLPAGGIDRLIERVEVSAGGIQLSQGLNMYNCLREAKDCLYGYKANSVLSHPEMVRAVSYVDGKPKLLSETYDENNLFCIDYWDSFIGTCEPRIIDAALFPSDIVVTIYLASANVLSASGSTANAPGNNLANFVDVAPSGVPSYELTNIHFTIETIGMANAVYDNMLEAMMSNPQKPYLEIPFKQYFSFNNTHSGSTKFSVSTESLDRIWICMRNNDYNTVGHPFPVKGYENVFRTIEARSDKIYPASNATYADFFHVPQHGFKHLEVVLSSAPGIATPAYVAVVDDNWIQLYDNANLQPTDLIHWNDAYVGESIYSIAATHAQPGLGHVFDSAKEKYIGKYFKFEEPPSHSKNTYQISLNGALYPQFPSTIEEIYNITSDSVIGYHCDKNLTLMQYKDSSFVMCLRLNLPDSEYSRTISGLDCRGTNLQSYFNTTNIDSSNFPDPNVLIFCECSSTARIGQNRQLEIII